MTNVSESWLPRKDGVSFYVKETAMENFDSHVSDCYWNFRVRGGSRYAFLKENRVIVDAVNISSEMYVQYYTLRNI